MHEVYAEWRALFDRYDPPRMAVAEAWVPAHRRARYASPESLGQAFNFDLLTAPWEAEAWRRVITENLALAAESGSTSTWVLSNHDVIRHPSRYGITAAAGQPNEIGYIPAFGVDPEITVDRALGAARARAATLLMLALPGSAYLYQGEELGLFEVTEIDARPAPGPDVLPYGWRPARPRRLPRPAAVDQRAAVLRLQPGPGHGPAAPAPAGVVRGPERRAGVGRRGLQPRPLPRRPRPPALAGARARGSPGSPSGPGVVHVERPGGWVCLTNFGPDPVPLPDGEVLLTSGPLADGQVPADRTVWLRRA